MSSEDLIGSAIVVTYFTMLAIEALANGRQWPRQRWWRAEGVAFFLMLMAVNAVLPSLLPPSWRAHSLLDGRVLGVPGGVAVGFVVFTLATALLHRAYHRFDLLWRWVHQLHHAPQRVDIPGSALFTPQEVILNVLLFQLVVVMGLGIEPLAAAIVGYLGAFYGMFQHVNVRTPRWLGYLIQRPESHCVHHRRGVHAYNYADFPLWDLAMGTFRNPREVQLEVGFEGEASRRIGTMLVGRDANAALYGPHSRGSRDLAANPA